MLESTRTPKPKIFRRVRRAVTFNLGQRRYVPVVPIIPVAQGPRGRMTRHVSFLGSRKLVPMDHFSSRKEHYQPNHVYLEHVPSFPAQTATFGYPVILRKPGVTRSKSFAAMTTRSSHSAMVPHVSPPVLGDTLKSRTWNKYHTPPKPGHYVLVGNKKSLKIPKIPRPVRTFQMFDCVRKGVREFIDVTRDDIDQLHSRGLEQAASSAQLHGASRRTSHIAKTFWEENLKQGKLLETDKQLKSAERYLKKLEFHLSKVEELHDCYLIQHQLREGTKTMHRAYITSPGNKKNILSNVRYGMKECTQTMCLIEAQLEAMMGTFNCRLKGMAGFARLCSGDVFEVSLKHGNQKWKSRGRIEKTGNQRWDNAEYTMKAQIGDVLHIKGVEVRSFKSVILGQKSCDTRELFSSNPQLMTVSINANGSLKLSIIITWNPLDGVEDNLSVYEMPTRQQSPPKRRPVSVLALNGELTGSYMSLSEEERRLSSPHSLSQSRDDNFILKTSFPPSISANSSPNPSKSDARLGHRDSGFSSAINLPNSSPPVTHNKPMAPRPPSPEEGHKLKRSTPPMLRQQAQSTPALRNSSPVLAHSTLPPSILEYLHFPVTSQGSHDHKEPMTVEDALNILTTSLEDFHGQFRELEKLEDIVVLLEQILRKESRRSSHSSSISISIENALEAFDFLDTEENPEHDANKTDKHGDTNLLDTVLSSPESTAKTADSGIESLAKRLSEDTQLGSSSGSSPVPPTTGNDEVDQALIFHLLYCELLLGSLGVFGPLKCKEIYALDKLQKQADIIEKLIKIARKGSEVDLQAEMAELTEDKAVREFWVQCTDQSLLHVRPEKLVAALENKYGSQLQIKYNKDPKKMLRHLVARILDIANYEAEVNKPFCVVTLHQFMLYCKEQGGLSCVGELATQLNLIDKLCSPVSETVIRAILTLRDDLPAPCVLKVMGALLLTKAQDVYRCLASYLNLIRMKDKERDKAVVIFVEGLEDKTMEVRAGACVALSILKATESIQQMSYVCQSDTVNDVKIKAKEALLSLGAEGRKAYEEAQLSSHGFQGVQFRK